MPMDEREFEQGYANFHRGLNRLLRLRDVKAFKAHVARHPAQAGKLSHCLGLSDELAEIEMYKAILVRSALKDLHHVAKAWLKEKGIEPPTSKTGKTGPRKRGWKRGRGKNGKK
ncbi:MAG: hypothetical protein JRJ03_03500 [Deltaproteobacteria bacterium]|nr:hypothetical protein [Deltaproteobacteria bacterium]